MDLGCGNQLGSFGLDTGGRKTVSLESVIVGQRLWVIGSFGHEREEVHDPHLRCSPCDRSAMPSVYLTVGWVVRQSAVAFDSRYRNSLAVQIVSTLRRLSQLDGLRADLYSRAMPCGTLPSLPGFGVSSVSTTPRLKSRVKESAGTR
jgi:hypothetical protein